MPSRFASSSWSSIADRRARGKARREQMHRVDQAAFSAPGERADLALQLQAAVAGRQDWLLPIRWWRMGQSPFYFYRGSAALMAADLGAAPTAGLEAQLCGDAHLLNLGAYADPEGRLVFDLNDFDEACRGPFEWDLKRLAASFVLAGREAGQSESACADAVRALVRAWREGLQAFAELPALELARVLVRAEDGRAPLAPIFEKAARDTPARLLQKATEADPAGFFRFAPKPPLLRRMEDAELAALEAALPAYLDSLPPARRQVMAGYAPWDAGHRAAGCGSFGVKDHLLLFRGASDQDALFLEFKAQPGSCWRRGAAGGHRGREVAEATMRLQTWADPFVGWTSIAGEAFLVRQWSDHKASFDVDMLQGATLQDYAALCGHVLAKAQARSGDAAMLAGYAGDADKLDKALAAFAAAYADQATTDWKTFKAAIAAGRFEVQEL